MDQRTAPIAPSIAHPVRLDAAPSFADDGFLAGNSEDVLRALAHIRSVMPQLGLRFSRLEVATAAGGRHAVDLGRF